MGKRKRKTTPEQPKPRDPFVLLMYMVAGTLGLVMILIVALIALKVIPERDRVTALGGLGTLATGATTAAGIAANRGTISTANARQTQQIEAVTNKQTDELKDHAVGILTPVKSAYDDWAKWNASKNTMTDQSRSVTFIPDAESEANKRARAEWRQQQPSPPT